MQLVRLFLTRLLKVSSHLEQSARERKLSRETDRLNRIIFMREQEQMNMLEEAERATQDLQKTISGLNQILAARDKSIEALEHQIEVLQYDVKGMTSVNARLSRWVEAVRTAEERPLRDQRLNMQLDEIEGSVPWPAT